MTIPACSKIPIAALKKESDPKKRMGRRLDIGRLRHPRPETSIDTLKKEIAPRGAMRWRMGFGAGKSPANGTRFSLSPYSVAQTVEIASTDTPSDVSVAVSQARQRFATLAATDPRLISAEIVPKSQPLKDGGRGSDNQRRGVVAESDLAHRKFLANEFAQCRDAGFGKRVPLNFAKNQ